MEFFAWGWFTVGFSKGHVWAQCVCRQEKGDDGDMWKRLQSFLKEGGSPSRIININQEIGGTLHSCGVKVLSANGNAIIKCKIGGDSWVLKGTKIKMFKLLLIRVAKKEKKTWYLGVRK